MPADRQLPTGGVSENPNLKSPSWGLLNTVFLMLDACRHFTSFPDTLPTGGHHMQVFKTVFLMVDACRHLTSSAISSTAYLKSHISILPIKIITNFDIWNRQIYSSQLNFNSRYREYFSLQTEVFQSKSSQTDLISTAAIENSSLVTLLQPTMQPNSQSGHSIPYDSESSEAFQILHSSETSARSLEIM